MPRTAMRTSTRTSTATAPVEPLFAHHARLWLRVWAATQAAAVAVALVVLADGAGGIAGFLRSPLAPRVGALLVVLVAYHAVGVWGYAWLLRRPRAVLVFVPLGWALVLAALGASGGFGLLLVGAVLQGFLFLPFTWAAATLAAVTAAVAGLVGVGAWRAAGGAFGAALARVVAVVATGVVVGTVLLYVHRANREAIHRGRLLEQLRAAQAALAERAREAGVQAERQRFARDIHDTLAQGFASVLRHLEAVELSLAPSARAGARGVVSAEAVMAHLAPAQAVSRASLAEIRRLVWALRPAPLDGAPLAPALERIVARWGADHAVDAAFAAEALPDLRPDAEVVFLRATQEALSNVARHAGARRVAVSLGHVDGLALLTVEDDGRGFTPRDEGGGAEGLGLTGMRERVRRFGGHVLVESAAGEGTSVTVALPLAAVAAGDAPGSAAGDAA